MRTRTIETGRPGLSGHVHVTGAGPVVVYIPGFLGPAGDPLIAALAEHCTVVTPLFPGTADGDHDAVHEIADVLDLLSFYDDVFEATAVEGAVLVGGSFGGMVAAELAAFCRGRWSGIVLAAPLGLWDDRRPIVQVPSLSLGEMRETVFADPAAAAAERVFGALDDPAQEARRLTALTWSIGCAAKFAWPFADTGVRKRLHRVSAPVDIVWGSADAVADPSYSDDFASLISAPVTVSLLPRVGHLVTHEAPGSVVDAVLAHTASLSAR